MTPKSYNKLMAENQRKYCELMGQKFHEGFEYGTKSKSADEVYLGPREEFKISYKLKDDTVDQSKCKGTMPMGYEPRAFATDVRTFADQLEAYAEFMKSAHTYNDFTPNDIIYTITEKYNKGENTMPVNYNEFFTTGRLYTANVYLPKIKDVIFNPPATIVLWDDKTKTVVKAYNEDYDPEKGLAMCILKKVYGNKGRYFNNISKWTDKYWAKKEAEAEAEIPNEVVSDPAKKVNLIYSSYFYARFLNFDTREDALDILDKMKKVRDTYGYVSVADLNDLVGFSSIFLDSKLGWSSLRGSQINRMRDGGYKLRLPEFNWVAEGYEIKE